MSVVYKYPVSLGSQKLQIPLVNRGILSAGIDFQGQPCIWAEVSPYGKESTVEVILVGTGWNCPEDGVFLGTITDQEMRWHAFYIVDTSQ